MRKLTARVHHQQTSPLSKENSGCASVSTIVPRSKTDFFPSSLTPNSFRSSSAKLHAGRLLVQGPLVYGNFNTLSQKCGEDIEEV